MQEDGDGGITILTKLHFRLTRQEGTLNGGVDSQLAIARLATLWNIKLPATSNPLGLP